MSYIIKMPEDAGTRYEVIKYPAGELQVRIYSDYLRPMCAASSVTIVANIRDGQVMELALLADAVHNIVKGLAPINLVLPYLPYARADRRFTSGDCNGLRTFGAVIDGMGFTNVFTLDAHSSMARRAIANLVDIYPGKLIAKAIKDIGAKDLVVLLPDKGAEARYTDLGVKVAYCEKHREAKSGKLSGFTVPDIDEGKVLIVDDICDGGGTFLGIAEELRRQRGFHGDLYLYVTHGIFSKGLGELSETFLRIYTSDSFRKSDTCDSPNVEIYPSWPLFKTALEEKELARV